MSNFYNILKKEVRELITKQLIITLVFICVIFGIMGKISRGEMKEAKRLGFCILDLDGISELNEIVPLLKKEGISISLLNDKTVEEAITETEKKKFNTLIVIPCGTSEKLKRTESAEVEVYAIVNSLAINKVTEAAKIKKIFEAINDQLAKMYLRMAIPDKSPEDILQPLAAKNFLVIRGKRFPGNPAILGPVATSHSTMIPIVLVFVIMYAGQLIMTSMGMEKENKTLETLLSLPIKRSVIISGKMVGAAIVAIIMTGVYMLGFKYYLSGVTGTIGKGVDLKSIGLAMGSLEYGLLGISLFLAILSALSLCIVLGVFVQDVKSAQTISLPVSLLVMIPFIISMFKNIWTLPMIPRLLIYVIPFSHPIIASQALVFGHYGIVAGGMVYMITFIMIMVAITSAMFRSDIVLTGRFAQYKLGNSKS